MRNFKIKNTAGFTLLEILIALFVFAILSTLLTAALHRIINTEASVSRHASQLRELEFTLIRIANDVEQASMRPVLTASGKEAPAFNGTREGFSLTRMGIKPERVTYWFNNNTLYRLTTSVLDASPETVTHKRQLLSPISAVRFQYENEENHLQSRWPREGQANTTLPKAIKMTMTLPEWGEITQVYVIPAAQTKQNETDSQP